MRMSVTPERELAIEHNGQTLLWNGSNFDKKCFGEDYDITKHINQYWAHLPHHRQEKIYGLYAKIRMIFEEVYETQQLIEELLPAIKALYEEHTLDEVGHWIGFYSDIAIPTGRFDETYVVSDERAGNREKTYLRSDYERLVSLALCLRVMVPVWGEFIYRTKKETGTSFKEYYAFQLLGQTELMNSVPMEKLRIYVQSNIQMDKPMHSTIIGGVGSQDYPIWLLGLVVVRRLCIGDISGSNPLTHLVTYIFNYISNKVNGNNSPTFGGMVKNKEFDSGDASDHNVSRIEGYKIKQEAPIGDMVILEHFMETPLNVARLLKPDIDLGLVEVFLQHAKTLEGEPLWKPQIVLTQWVLNPVLSPRGVTQLSKLKTINAIAVAQAWLWTQGHHQLACLITAIASSTESELQLGGIDSRAKIMKDQMDELARLYPYTKVASAKQKTKPTNSAVSAIDSVASMLGQRDWILTAPNDCAAIVTKSESLRRYSCPYDIRILLAKLVIELAQRP